MKPLKFFIVLVSYLMPIMIQAQVIDNPNYDSKNNSNITIMKIEITDYNTIIHFIYQASSEYVNGGWFNINPSIYIKNSDGYTKYKLIKADGVPLAPEKKQCDYVGQILTFRLIFPKIDSYASKLDIIECSTDNCFNFYGVSLRNSKSSSTSENETKKFRVDYSLVTFYDPKTEEWSDWSNADNTFVININEKGDVAHLRADGKTVIYKRLSGVEEGYTDNGKHYQIIKALDEDGDVFRFQLFDDSTVGLKMMWGNTMIQFAKP